MDADGRPSQDRRRSGGGEGGRVPQTARSRGGDVGEPSRRSDLMHHLYAAACAQHLLCPLDPCPVRSRHLRSRSLAPSHAHLRCILEKAAVAIEKAAAVTATLHMQSKDMQNEITASHLAQAARIAAAEAHGAWVTFAQRTGVSVPERLRQLDESAKQYHTCVGCCHTLRVDRLATE